jgi:hypothetical protein
MGRSKLRIRIGVAAEGLRARVSAASDRWDEPDFDGETDDVSEWLQLPRDFRAPDDDGAACRRQPRLEMTAPEDDFDSKWLSYSQDEVV